MNKHKEKGITLIALIITIIVLLILAGITIGTLTSNNSILKQAGNAKNNTKIAKEKEIIELSVMGAVSLNKDALLVEREFQDQLTKNADSGNPEIIEADEDGYIVKFEDEDGKRYYNVPNSSDIEQIDGVTSEKTLTVQCVNSKNEILKEQTYTILTNRYSKNPPTVEGYQVADNNKIEGDITESKTVKVLYYLLLQDDSTLVFTGLDSSGNVTENESSIVSYMIGTGSGTYNAIKNSGDENIKSILKIPDTYKGKPVVSIPSLAFASYASGCKLISVKLSENTKTINTNAFTKCGGFKEITFPKNLTYIYNDAFISCTSLEKIHFKNKIQSYNHAFSGTNLKEFEIDSDSTAYYLENKNILFSKDKKTIILCIIKDQTEYVIPNYVTTLAQHSFTYSNLENIIFNENITVIPVRGLEGTKIKDFVIPDTVTSVGNLAFKNCSKLETLTVGSGVTSMSSNETFGGCSKLTTVIIRSSTIARNISSATSYANLVAKAETIYIKDNITTIGSYITDNFSVIESDRTGYVKYVKN